MRKIILEESDIQKFEQLINNMPCFAKNMSESMSVSKSIHELMDFMGARMQVEEEKPKPIGGGGGAGAPKPNPRPTPTFPDGE